MDPSATTKTSGPAKINVDADEPTRGELLIEAAKNRQPPGRFSLRWLFVITLLIAASLALLRQMGMLNSAEQLFWVLLVMLYCFAPFPALAVDMWLHQGRWSVRRIAIGVTLFAGLFHLTALLGNARIGDLLGIALIGAILWGMAAAVIGSVAVIFRDDGPKR